MKDKRKVSLEEATLFGSRDNLEEAYKYAESILERESKDSAVFFATALMIIWNTLATKYDIYLKDVDSE